MQYVCYVVLICMHALYVCMYVCLYVCMYVCLFACAYVRGNVCMYVCMHVRMHACMHACMHAWIYVYMHALIATHKLYFPYIILGIVGVRAAKYNKLQSCISLPSFKLHKFISYAPRPGLSMPPTQPYITGHR